MKRLFLLAVTFALGLTAVRATLVTEFADLAPTPVLAGNYPILDILQYDLSQNVNSAKPTILPDIGEIESSAYNKPSSLASVSNPDGTSGDSDSLGLKAAWLASQTSSADDFVAAPHRFIRTRQPLGSFAGAPSSLNIVPSAFIGAGIYALTVDTTDSTFSPALAGKSLLHGSLPDLGAKFQKDFNTIQQVPEPSTLALLAIGGLLFGRHICNQRRLAR